MTSAPAGETGHVGTAWFADSNQSWARGLSFEASFRTPTVWGLECGGIRVPTQVRLTTYDRREQKNPPETENWQKD